jgi:hypothetical protein
VAHFDLHMIQYHSTVPTVVVLVKKIMPMTSEYFTPRASVEAQCYHTVHCDGCSRPCGVAIVVAALVIRHSVAVIHHSSELQPCPCHEKHNKYTRVAYRNSKRNDNRQDDNGH